MTNLVHLSTSAPLLTLNYDLKFASVGRAQPPCLCGFRYCLCNRHSSLYK